MPATATLHLRCSKIHIEITVLKHSMTATQYQSYRNVNKDYNFINRTIYIYPLMLRIASMNIYLF